MTPAFDSTSLIIAGVALAFGLLLLFIGLRGRRVGNEPRCRKCGYNLTGAISEHCSECGATINQQSIVHGTRRRRPVIIVLSLLIVAAAGTFGGLDGYKRLQTIDKYRYYPFSWLIDGTHSNDLRAPRELDRRLRADELSANQLQVLITAALAEQARATNATPGINQYWIEFLEYLARANRLPHDQLVCYLEQMCTYTLVPRPRVRAGDPLPVAIHSVWSGPSGRRLAQNWYVRFKAAVAPSNRIYYELLSDVGRRPNDTLTHAGDVYSMGTKETCGPVVIGITSTPGLHSVSCTAKVEIFDLRAGVPFQEQSLAHTRRLRLKNTYEVLPADAPDTVELVVQPDLAEQIRAALHIDDIEYSRSRRRLGQPLLTLAIETGPFPRTGQALPIDVAFDVFIRVNNRELPMSSVVFRAGSTDSKSVYGYGPVPPPSHVDVILRPSPNAARQTVDVFRIWDGEVVFTDVRVHK